MGNKFVAANAAGTGIAIYDDVLSPVPAGVNAIAITDAEAQQYANTVNCTFVNGAVVMPAPPTAAQIAQAAQAAAVSAASLAAIAAGVSLTSTSTPALNGTYAIDVDTQHKMTSVAMYISINGKFPRAQTTYQWPDISGTPHTFPSTALFSEFATAVADYVDGIDQYVNGTETALPIASLTIS